MIYTDNGTDFISTSAALKQVNWETIIAHHMVTPSDGNLYLPLCSTVGWRWELLICTSKELSVRVLGCAYVAYKELLTILCDIESVIMINNCPLTYVSNNSEDLSPLTPSIFFPDNKQLSTPDLDDLD